MPPETQQQIEGQPPPQDSTGTLKDQAPKPEPTTEPAKDSATPKAGATLLTEPAPEGKTLLTEKDTAPTGAPEKYEDFKAPDGWADKGWELDKEILTEASPLFKELNLSQDQAQKLVDFYAQTSAKASEASANSVIQQNEEWVKAVKADPEIGPRLATVKATVSKAIDSLGPELGSAFREAMDYTGVGNHPAFIKAFYKLAQRLTEGSHVAGKGPSEHGQTNPARAPKSAASALYPNLPSAG